MLPGIRKGYNTCCLHLPPAAAARTGSYISLLDYSINVTLQDFSSPAATRSFICKLWALQPRLQSPQLTTVFLLIWGGGGKKSPEASPTTIQTPWQPLYHARASGAPAHPQKHHHRKPA